MSDVIPQGFVLVSSNKDRILFSSSDYELTKKTQLYYLRNDQLYLCPIYPDNNPENFDFLSNPMAYTLSGATSLQVELDVPYRRSRHLGLKIKNSPPAPDDVNVNKNLIFCSKIIPVIDSVFEKRYQESKRLNQYTIKGLEMFENFCGDMGLECGDLFEKDISDERQFEDSVLLVKRQVVEIIMSKDFSTNEFVSEITKDMMDLEKNSSIKNKPLIKTLLIFLKK